MVAVVRHTMMGLAGVMNEHGLMLARDILVDHLGLVMTVEVSGEVG